jgi:predicted enzyme related to lactoylglutathione lyase
MINAVHAVIYTKDADAVRAFFRDVLGFSSVDAGHGWLIFALPPAELGMHPTDSDSQDGRHQLYLMCDDLAATVTELKHKGVEFTEPIKDAGWGLLIAMKIPGGGELRLPAEAPLASTVASAVICSV